MSLIATNTVKGKLPAWFWRELHATTKATKRIPMLIVEEGQSQIVCMDVRDYNRLIDAIKAGDEGASA